MTRTRPALAILSVSLVVIGSCTDKATLLTPDAPQNAVVAPQCFGRNATIYVGSPGAGTITPDGSGGYTITGTSGNDVIVGGPGNDIINAGSGTDRVCGGDGNDVLSGGDGTNYIDGELGSDVVDYSAAAAGVNANLVTGKGRGGTIIDAALIAIENIIGSAFDDYLRGDAATNTIRGGDGNDILYGLEAADSLIGQDGNDEVRGGDDADVLSGGTGDDEIFPGLGADVIVGQGGFDVVDYNNSAAVNVNLATNVATGGDAEGDTYAGIEGVRGTANNDVLTGNDLKNTLEGRGGDDIIHGAGGRDRLVGGDGADEIHGGTENDDIHGQEGDDELHGDDGDDVFVPGGGQNTVDGGNGTDRIVSGNCLDGVLSVEIMQSGACDADVNTSEVHSAMVSLVADGVSSTSVWVQLKDADGNNFTIGGATVVISTTAGTLTTGGTPAASVTAQDNGDGTYSATLTSSTTLETATITATVDGNAIVDDASVDFTHGALDHFVITDMSGDPIAQQQQGVPFDIMIVAEDANNHRVGDYSATVDVTYEGGTGGDLATATLVSGITSHTVTIDEGANIQIRVTGSGKTGLSNSFDVTSSPDAVDEGAASGSTPGDDWHGTFNTDLSDNVITNDTRGFPLGNVESFGAIETNDGAGAFNPALGTVTSNAAGASVTLGDGSLTVNADGTFTFDPPTDYTGLLRFQYRLSNSGGSDDATVTLAIGVRPSAANSSYPIEIVGNVPINTAISSNEMVNAAGDDITLAVTGTANGTGSIASDKTYSFAPSAGYAGPAGGITFTATNGFGTTDPATVTIDVGTPVWFIDAAAPGGGDGTKTAPFNCINGAGCFTPAAHEAGDRIYIASGTYTNAGLTLLINQRLIGAAANADFATTSGLTWPADAGALPAHNGAPVNLSATSGNLITLTNGNTLRGLTLGNAPQAALRGATFGTLTVASDVSINTNQQAINLSTGTISGDLGGVTSTGHGGDGYNISLANVGGTSNFGGGALSGAAAAFRSILVNSGTGTFTYSGSISGSGGAADIANKTAGGVTLSGNINVTGRGISLTGNTGGTYTFSGASKAINTSGTSNPAVILTSNNGATIDFSNGGLALTTSTARAFDASNGGTLIVTGSGNTITTTGAASHAMHVTDMTSGTGGINFASINAGSATTGAGVRVNNVSGQQVALGAVTIGGGVIGLQLTSNAAAITATPTIDAINGTGVLLTSNTGTVTLGAGAIGNTDDPAGNAVAISGGNAAVSIAAPITKSTSNRLVDVSGRTGGTVTISGNLNCTVACTGISVTSNTGGTIEFTAGTKTLNTPGIQPVTFSSNTGNTTLRFSNGGLAITSGSQTGILASNTLATNATLQVQGASNTITSTTGTALSVSNTTIGAAANGTEGGLNFQSISVNGAANGIFLSQTGSTAGLTVTGDGANTTKGGNGSGGVIQNISGADGSTNGIGIYLNNTRDVVLRRMTLGGTIQNMGVYGERVNNFILQYSTIGGSIGTSAGDLHLETPISFGKTSPAIANGFAHASTSTIDNVLISGGIQHNVQVFQQADSFKLTISNSNITNNSAAFGSDGLLIETHTDGNGGTSRANATIAVSNSQFDNNKSQALQANALGDSYLDLTLDANTFQATTQGNEGVVLQNGADGDMRLHITNNNFTGIKGTMLMFGSVAGNATANASLTAYVDNNTLTQGSPVANRALIFFPSSTAGQVSVANVLLNNNRVTSSTDAEAFFISTPDPNTSASFTATVTNNTVTMTSTTGFALRGMALQATQGSNPQGVDACLDVRGNTVTYTNGQPPGIAGLRVRQANPGGGVVNPTIRLEQGTSAGTPTAVLAANNPGAVTEVVGTVSTVSNSTCLTPPSN